MKNLVHPHSLHPLALADLEKLYKARSFPSISLYMPAVTKGKDRQQDPIRLKNLLAKAQHELHTNHLYSKGILEAFKEPESLVDNQDFWTHTDHGLGLLISEEIQYVTKLPFEPQEVMEISDHFHLRPLLRLFGQNDSFIVLCLFANKISVFQATQYGMVKLEIPGLPTSVDSYLPEELQERNLQADSSGVIHGQYEPETIHKQALTTFFKEIDLALGKALHSGQKIVLVGVEYELALYRGLTSQKAILTAEIVGNWQHLPEHELHDRAWKAVQPEVDQELQREIKRVHDTQGEHPDRIVTDMDKIVIEASRGKIDTLFLSVENNVWGTFNAETETVTHNSHTSTKGSDLLDTAACETLFKHGKVFALPSSDVPLSSIATAILRY